MNKILEYGIYLVVFCLPMYLVRFSVLGLPTNVLEVMIGVLFVIWLVHANLNANYKRIWIRIKSCKEILIPIILILIGVSIATIFSWDLRLSAGIWKGWFVIPLIFFVILITSIKPEQVKKIFYSLVASGFIVSIISLIYLIQGNLDIHGRLQGIYNSPNFLAMYLNPTLIVGFGLFYKDHLHKDTRQRPSEALRSVSASLFPLRGKPCPLGLRRFFLVSGLCLIIIIIFFTKSAGAWIGLLGAFLFGLLVCFYKKKNKKWFYIVLIMGIAIILLLSYFKIFISSEGGRSYDARLLIWQRAWQAYKMNPVVGIGPGTFEYYFPPYPKWGVPQPHNLYLAFLLQTGIVGFIGFIWLLIWFYKKGFKLLKTQNLLVVTIMSIMVYILIHGLVDTTYWKNDLAILFWTILALLSIVGRFSYSQTSNKFPVEKETNQQHHKFLSFLNRLIF